jgi:hypothetical protein
MVRILFEVMTGSFGAAADGFFSPFALNIRIEFIRFYYPLD